MSRKLFKVRVWDGTKMHDDGFHIDMDGEVYDCGDTGPGGIGWSHRLHKDHIVLEYTGVNDDNGAELYTDDVVDTELGHAIIGFQHGFFCLNWLEEDRTRSDSNVELLGCNWKGRKREKLVLVGNIHEDPKLVK